MQTLATQVQYGTAILIASPSPPAANRTHVVGDIEQNKKIPIPQLKEGISYSY